MSILNFKSRKFKSDIPLGNGYAFCLTEKAYLPRRNIANFPKKCNQKTINIILKFITGKASQPLRNISIFLKKCNQKSMISGSETKKIVKSKNALKTLLGAFNQEI